MGNSDSPGWSELEINPTVDSPSLYEYSTNMQPELFDATKRYTVSSLTRRLRNLIETDDGMQGIWVEGEVSNHSRPASGHMYFTLKDAGAQLRCVMWRNEVAKLRIPLQDGMLVEAFGSLGIYEAGGQYQLYTNILRPLGEGALFAEFLRLKAVLEAEGLFAVERKREIPELAEENRHCDLTDGSCPAGHAGYDPKALPPGRSHPGCDSRAG